MMFSLASLIYSIASVTLMGVLIIVALTTGYDTSIYIASAAVIGAVVALPVSYFVAMAIKGMD